MSWYAYKRRNPSTNKIMYTCRIQHYFLHKTLNGSKPEGFNNLYSLCNKVFHMPSIEEKIKKPLPHCKRCELLLKHNIIKITAMTLKQ